MGESDTYNVSNEQNGYRDLELIAIGVHAKILLHLVETSIADVDYANLSV